MVELPNLPSRIGKAFHSGSRVSQLYGAGHAFCERCRADHGRYGILTMITTYMCVARHALGRASTPLALALYALHIV